MRSAEHMTWHHRYIRKEGVIQHPSDADAWKHFNRTHPEFAAEPRNVRLGLCADGFNPFNQMAKSYSCWPVMITPYNLPPGMCMTEPYIFLTLLIPGPRNPKARIDVFMQPLIDDLKLLWATGVETYDVSKKNNFKMKAALMWTIGDFPAYGMLSGWSTAGRLACPVCMENTKAFRLQHGGKISWFDCHRCFLPKGHPYRGNKVEFCKGVREKELAPPRLSGDEVWQRIRDYPRIIDRPSLVMTSERLDGYGVRHNWTKRSIFWNLPY
jgi:hypothetical protein